MAAVAQGWVKLLSMTSFKFTPDAVKRIVKDFRASESSGSATCTYNERTHAFEVTCLAEKGLPVLGLLEDLINGVVRRETSSPPESNPSSSVKPLFGQMGLEDRDDDVDEELEENEVDADSGASISDDSLDGLTPTDYKGTTTYIETWKPSKMAFNISSKVIQTALDHMSLQYTAELNVGLNERHIMIKDTSMPTIREICTRLTNLEMLLLDPCVCAHVIKVSPSHEGNLQFYKLSDLHDNLLGEILLQSLDPDHPQADLTDKSLSDACVLRFVAKTNWYPVPIQRTAIKHIDSLPWDRIDFRSIGEPIQDATDPEPDVDRLPPTNNTPLKNPKMQAWINSLPEPVNGKENPLMPSLDSEPVASSLQRHVSIQDAPKMPTAVVPSMRQAKKTAPTVNASRISTLEETPRPSEKWEFISPGTEIVSNNHNSAIVSQKKPNLPKKEAYPQPPKINPPSGYQKSSLPKSKLTCYYWANFRSCRHTASQCSFSHEIKEDTATNPLASPKKHKGKPVNNHAKPALHSAVSKKHANTARPPPPPPLVPPPRKPTNMFDLIDLSEDPPQEGSRSNSNAEISNEKVQRSKDQDLDQVSEYLAADDDENAQFHIVKRTRKHRKPHPGAGNGKGKGKGKPKVQPKVALQNVKEWTSKHEGARANPENQQQPLIQVQDSQERMISDDKPEGSGEPLDPTAAVKQHYTTEFESESEDDEQKSQGQKQLGFGTLRLAASLKTALTNARIFPGTLQIEVQFGVILVPKALLPDSLRKKEQDRGGIPPVLESIKDFGKHQTFSNVLSAQPDVFAIVKDMKLLRTAIEWEFVCKRTDNSEVRLSFNASTKGDIHPIVNSWDKTFGTTYMHFPERVHDARFVVSGKQTKQLDEHDADETDVYELFRSLIIQDSPATLPTVTWRDTAGLNTKAVRLHSVAYYGQLLFDENSKGKVTGRRDRVFLKITRIHDLPVFGLDGEQGLFCAATPQGGDETLQQEHRLWYEMSLVEAKPSPKLSEGSKGEGLRLGTTVDWTADEVVDVETVAEMQALAANIVHRIDSVGAENHGPAWKANLKVKKNYEKRRVQQDLFW